MPGPLAVMDTITFVMELAAASVCGDMNADTPVLWRELDCIAEQITQDTLHSVVISHQMVGHLLIDCPLQM